MRKKVTNIQTPFNGYTLHASALSGCLLGVCFTDTAQAILCLWSERLTQCAQLSRIAAYTADVYGISMSQCALIDCRRRPKQTQQMVQWQLDRDGIKPKLETIKTEWAEPLTEFVRCTNACTTMIACTVHLWTSNTIKVLCLLYALSYFCVIFFPMTIYTTAQCCDLCDFMWKFKYFVDKKKMFKK